MSIFLVPRVSSALASNVSQRRKRIPSLPQQMLLRFSACTIIHLASPLPLPNLDFFELTGNCKMKDSPCRDFLQLLNFWWLSPATRDCALLSKSSIKVFRSGLIEDHTRFANGIYLHPTYLKFDGEFLLLKAEKWKSNPVLLKK